MKALSRDYAVVPLDAALIMTEHKESRDEVYRTLDEAFY